MKLTLLAFAAFVSLTFGASAKWNKHYAIVNKDIRSIERLPSKDLELKIRLFELYGEKLALLLEIENEFRMAYLDDSKYKKKLDQSLSLQKKVLGKIQGISTDILSSTRDREIIGKIHYYKALSYLFLKDYRSYEAALLKAERYARDPEVVHSIRVKLADHYYNEKQFVKAVKRYRLAAKKKDDKWRSKIYYNLAWCEFKLGLEKTALARIKFALKLSNSKYYHAIGDQLADSIMLFFANAKKTDEGLAFLKANKLDAPEQLLRFAHHVYELGRKPDVIKVFQRMDQTPSTIDEKTKIMTKKVEIYRNLKQFARIQNNLTRYKATLKNSNQKPSKLEKDGLITAVLGYNGFLQELIKVKQPGREKYNKRYAAYIYKNLETLKQVDPQNEPQYAYFQGETYLELGNYSTATVIYTNAIKAANALKKPDLEILAKIFESVFKSMEKSSPNPKRLVYVFESYLRHFPRTDKADSIHQRLIALSMKRKDKRPVLARIARYHKAYPRRIAVQRDFYKELLNFYIDQKNTEALEALKNTLAKGFLKFDQREIAKVNKAVESLRFEKYEKMAKAGKIDQATKGFLAMSSNPKNDRDLRISALRKAQFYQNQESLYGDLSRSLSFALKLYSTKELANWSKELKFYLNNVCMSSFTRLDQADDDCLSLRNSWVKAKMEFPEQLKELYFRKLVSMRKYDKAYSMANSRAGRLDYLFQSLTLSYPNFDHRIYGELYKLPKFKKQIESLVKLRFWRRWFNTLDFEDQEDYAQNFSVEELKQDYVARTRNAKELAQAKVFAMPPQPDPKVEVTFEAFSKYLEALTNATAAGFQSIDESFTKVDPNYLPFLVMEQAKKLEAEIPQIRSYTPNTKDENLAKAITTEVEGIASIYEQKLSQYRDFYPVALNGVIKGVGGQNYKTGMRSPTSTVFSNHALWEGY